MRAKRGNKEYIVADEAQAKDYNARGFDIMDDGGKIIMRNPQKKIAYAAHEAAVAEMVAAIELRDERIAELEGALAAMKPPKPISQMNKEELLAACAGAGIMPPDDAKVEQLRGLLKAGE